MHTEIPIDAQLICGALVHVDSARVWRAPNDGLKKDPLGIKSIEGSSREGGWTVEFSHEATALRHNQVDAYLRHVQNVVQDLFRILEPLGCFEVGIALKTWARLATIRKETLPPPPKKKK